MNDRSPGSRLFPYTTLFRSMIIAEAPGKDEDETGKPFVGSAGRYLDHVLEGTKGLPVSSDRKSTRLNSSHRCTAYAGFGSEKKKLAFLTLTVVTPVASGRKA